MGRPINPPVIFGYRYHVLLCAMGLLHTGVHFTASAPPGTEQVNQPLNLNALCISIVVGIRDSISPDISPKPTAGSLRTKIARGSGGRCALCGIFFVIIIWRRVLCYRSRECQLLYVSKLLIASMTELNKRINKREKIPTSTSFVHNIVFIYTFIHSLIDLLLTYTT